MASVRTSVERIVDTAQILYGEYETLEERIKADLAAKFETVPYRNGRVAAIKSVKVEPSVGLESYASGLRFIAKFEATIEVKYLNLGDMLFAAKISEKQETLGGREVLESNLPFRAVALDVPANITTANLVLSSITSGTPPDYLFNLAIFPRNAPIVLGETHGKVELPAPLYAFRGKMPTPSKYIDPYFKYRVKKKGKDQICMVTLRIAEFAGIPMQFGVRGDEYLHTSHKYKASKVDDITRPLILFVPLNELENALSKLKHDYTVIHHPVIPLDKPFVAIVVFPPSSAGPRAFDATAIKYFRQRVEEHWEMKRLEGEAMKRVSKPFLDILSRAIPK